MGARALPPRLQSLTELAAGLLGVQPADLEAPDRAAAMLPRVLLSPNEQVRGAHLALGTLYFRCSSCAAKSCPTRRGHAAAASPPASQQCDQHSARDLLCACRPACGVSPTARPWVHVVKSRGTRILNPLPALGAVRRCGSCSRRSPFSRGRALRAAAPTRRLFGRWPRRWQMPSWSVLRSGWGWMRTRCSPCVAPSWAPCSEGGVPFGGVGRSAVAAVRLSGTAQTDAKNCI